MKSWTRTLFLLLALSVAATAQTSMTVDQLVGFIKSSIQLKQDDRQIATFLKTKKVTLTNKLDARTVETLQGMGAGPQTVAALRLLITESAGLAAPPPPAPKPVVVGPPPPDSIEQKKILAEITESALNYTKSLPNFICMQVTRRYADVSGLENYRLMDTIAEKLSYFEQKEDYKVVSKNNIPVTTNLAHEQLDGATSSGEFGSMLFEIFSPETETTFDWERWATLRGRRMYVFSFRVEQSRSKYSIRWGRGVGERTVLAGYHGLIYADRDTNMVMRIKMECDHLPVDFPIQSVDLDLNYDFTNISGQPFLLPLKSELHSREGKMLVKNETEFRLYNKFSTEAIIQFGDTPEPLPENQTKEEPVK
jgi:hypothetical protein